MSNNKNYDGISTIQEQDLLSRQKSQGHVDTSILDTITEKNVSVPMIGRTIYCIDTSSSMKWKCGQHTKIDSVSYALISSFGIAARSMPGNEVALITFDSYSKTVCGFVNIEQGYQQLVKTAKSMTAQGGTSIPNALQTALDLFGNNISSNDTLILMSDGQGGNGVPLANELKGHGVTIKVVGFGGDNANLDEAMLKKMASVQDGKVLYEFASNRNSLTKTFADYTKADVTKVL